MVCTPPCVAATHDGAAATRCALAAAVAAATHDAVLVVDAAVAAPSFVTHFSVAVAAVVVASPLHILVQHVLPQLERQQLTVRPGFEPQACRVPTQRGIYLFSVTVDIIQARCTCTAASNCPYHHVFWRAACALAAASAADAHVADSVGVHSSVMHLCLSICCLPRGTWDASRRGHFRVRDFSGVFVFPR